MEDMNKIPVDQSMPAQGAVPLLHPSIPLKQAYVNTCVYNTQPPKFCGHSLFLSKFKRGIGILILLAVRKKKERLANIPIPWQKS